MVLYFEILPVLFIEYLSLSLTRAILPSLLTYHFPSNIYILVGLAECVKGVLAFVGCSVIGSYSDRMGRRKALLLTVCGTTFPLLVLSILSVFFSSNTNEDEEFTKKSLTLFIVLLSLSGFFSCTFTLVFAYITDLVPQKSRISAYGLALATFGLSFSIGPLIGSYLSDPDSFVRHYRYQYDGTADVIIKSPTVNGIEYPDPDGPIITDLDQVDLSSSHYFTTLNDPGAVRVFRLCIGLILVDISYVYFVLRESLGAENQEKQHDSDSEYLASAKRSSESTNDNTTTPAPSLLSIHPPPSSSASASIFPNLPSLTKPITTDPLLSEIALITFLYYIGVWGLISTLTLYCTITFNFSTRKLGELMSVFGLCTVFSEGILVRVLVPLLGEVTVIRVGLIAFSLQCIFISLATEPYHIFICLLFSTLSNLVYPSISSLVSKHVSGSQAGKTLGSINGIKSLTEGISPLIFGVGMTMCRGTMFPGAPYLVAAGFSLAAYYRTVFKLPSVDGFSGELYVSEKYEYEDEHEGRSKNRHMKKKRNENAGKGWFDFISLGFGKKVDVEVEMEMADYGDDDEDETSGLLGSTSNSKAAEGRFEFNNHSDSDEYNDNEEGNDEKEGSIEFGNLPLIKRATKKKISVNDVPAAV